MIIRTRAYARAGLIGNPSDGYFGKTISVIVPNFSARVTCYESPRLSILPRRSDPLEFESIDALVENVRLNGYYGGIRLIKATIKRFADYCREKGVVLDNRNFTIEYETDIPVRVGLAGSSGIVTATLRALLSFYGVEIAKAIMPNLILSVELDELGIGAGLQDRVIQVYEGLVYMDFDKRIMDEQGFGKYESLDPALLPNVYVAYRTSLSEGTEVFHNDIRGRYNAGDQQVVNAMKRWAQIAAEGRQALLDGDRERLGRLIDENFDLRASIYKISAGNMEMIGMARGCGATAKFAGSGGAIVGTYGDEEQLARMTVEFEKIGVAVVRPRVTA